MSSRNELEDVLLFASWVLMVHHDFDLIRTYKAIRNEIRMYREFRRNHVDWEIEYDDMYRNRGVQ